MRRWWRQTALGMVVIGIVLALGVNPGRTESRAHVYLLRGLMNIFSLGMDTLAEQLNRRGVYATVHGYGEWQALADRAAVDYKAGKEGPIILIGHSLGADAVMEMAAYLGHKGIPVALLVPFDGTRSYAASDNVAHVLNLTQRDYAYMRRGPGFHGTLNNIDVSSDPSIDHINIDKSPRLHARVVSEVLAVVGGGHRLATPGAAKSTSGNGTAPAGQETGATGAPASGGSPAKHDEAPGATPPAKSGNGADAGTAAPVADGTPIIARPERTGRQPATEPPPIRAEQVPH